MPHPRKSRAAFRAAPVVQLNVNLPVSLRKALAELAARRGTSSSEVLREALARYVSAHLRHAAKGGAR